MRNAWQLLPVKHLAVHLQQRGGFGLVPLAVRQGKIKNAVGGCLKGEFVSCKGEVVADLIRVG